MASGILWKRTTQIAREETCRCHIGYSFRLAARVLLHASSHRQDNTYHGLYYTSRGALAGTRNSSMGSRWKIDPMSHSTLPRQTSAQRNNVTGRLQAEATQQAVARHFKNSLSRQTNSALWARFNTTQSVIYGPRSRRHRVTTAAQDWYIQLRHLRNWTNHSDTNPWTIQNFWIGGS